MIKKYKKKPVIIQAVQFTGHNDKQCLQFCPKARDPIDNKANLIIDTLQGDMLCSIGDYIIKGVKGQFYPCKPDIFEMTYEEQKKDLVRLVKFEDHEQPQYMSLVCEVGPGIVVQGHLDSLVFAIKTDKPHYYKQDLYIVSPLIPQAVVKKMAKILQERKQKMQQYYQEKGKALKQYAEYLGVSTSFELGKQIVQDLQMLQPVNAESELKKSLRDHYIHIRMFELGFDMDNLDQYEINLDDVQIGYTKEQIEEYLTSKLNKNDENN